MWSTVSGVGDGAVDATMDGMVDGILDEILDQPLDEPRIVFDETVNGAFKGSVDGTDNGC